MTKFDVVNYLESEEDIAGYLEAAKEEVNPNVFLEALSDAARARGILQLAKDTGIDRKKLCKMLSSGEMPSSKIISKVTTALAAPLHAQV